MVLTLSLGILLLACHLVNTAGSVWSSSGNIGDNNVGGGEEDTGVVFEWKPVLTSPTDRIIRCKDKSGNDLNSYIDVVEGRGDENCEECRAKACQGDETEYWMDVANAVSVLDTSDRHHSEVGEEMSVQYSAHPSGYGQISKPGDQSIMNSVQFGIDESSNWNEDNYLSLPHDSKEFKEVSLADSAPNGTQKPVELPRPLQEVATSIAQRQRQHRRGVPISGGEQGERTQTPIIVSSRPAQLTGGWIKKFKEMDSEAGGLIVIVIESDTDD